MVTNNSIARLATLQTEALFNFPAQRGNVKFYNNLMFVAAAHNLQVWAFC